MIKGVNDFLINRKQIKALSSVRNGVRPVNISQAGKRADISYSHMTRIMQNFINMGLVEEEREGRSCWLELTKKGAAILYHLGKIESILEEQSKYCKTKNDKRKQK